MMRLYLISIIFYLVSGNNNYCDDFIYYGEGNACLSMNRHYLSQCDHGGSLACLCTAGCINNMLTCVNNTIETPKIKISYDIFYISQYYECLSDRGQNDCELIDTITSNYEPDEPIVTLTCLHNAYTENLSCCQSCDNNSNDICISANKIKYPLRLQNKYSRIMCKYSTHGNCANERIVKKCCN